MSENLAQLISMQGMQNIDKWIAKYPPEQKQSAVMEALMTVQSEHGYLTPPLMDAVANYLDMPAIAVYEVASFYSMYEHSPCGRNLINVCTNISCKLRGADELVDHLQKTLNIRLGETTADGRFTLRSVECLAACVNAPMMQINKTYHENLTLENVAEVLEGYE
jgi:NADH-quinone oxidoreductase subunit E